MLEKIAVAAAAASDSVDLIARLREFFPRHVVSREFDRYFAARQKAGKEAIAVSKNPKLLSFVKWMLQAEVPLTKPKPTASAPNKPEIRKPEKTEQMDLFDEVAQKRFVQQYEERKKRHEQKAQLAQRNSNSD